MPSTRREFLRHAGLGAGALLLTTNKLRAQTPDGGGWRSFEITTRVEVLEPAGRTRVWLPTPLVDTPYQRTLGDTYRAENGFVEMVERPTESLDQLVAEWKEGIAPVLTMTSRVNTRDHAVDLAQPGVPPPSDLSTFTPFLRPTRFIRTDGIVKTTADQITRDAGTDLERARAIYEWVVDKTFRDPKTLGCGTGDIRFMLESGNLGGKCADINGLFVGLARAAGIPAREVFGLRVAPSRRGAPSLGLVSPTATRAQHCRAEVYLTGFGWVPADPADVRKVALEEPAESRDERVRGARSRLFGSWEMNWIGFNYAHDIVLAGAKRGSIPYFMYPQAETVQGRIDSLEPDAFRYEITVKEST
ncbi:MAG TPA: transglutaminase domain-containing protein [Vicinamibacterales bacterium]